MRKIDLRNNTLIFDNKSNSPTYFSPTKPIYFENTVVDQLVSFGKSEKRNVRICLHSRKEDKMQEMLIYQTQNNFFPPKKHLVKEKSFHIIRGRLVICVFEDSGEINNHVILHSDSNLYCRIPSNIYHLDFPVDESVHLETTLGPFEREDTVFPIWYTESKRLQMAQKIINLINK